MALSQHIAKLTEEIKVLRAEKIFLMHTLNCDDATISDMKKAVVDKKRNLKELDLHKQKFSTELDATLQQYLDTKQKVENPDPNSLVDKRIFAR